MTEEEVDWTYPEGAIVIHDEYGRQGLVQVAHAPGSLELYGLHYIQFPERGCLNGGSGWSSRASVLRHPKTLEEHLWKQTFLAARRVRQAKDDLEVAEADVDALARVSALLRGPEDVVE